MAVEIAVVGAGKIGTKHARVVDSFPDAAVAHVVDADPEAADDLAGAVGAAASDLDAALADCDAVYVCTPDDAHAEVARRAIEAGRHTLVEKPLAATVDETDDLVSLASGAGGVHAVGHVLRFDARYRALADEVEAVGGVVAATAERLVSRARVRRRGEAISPALGLGVHDFDVLAWLLDDRIERVRALDAHGALRAEGYDVADVETVLAEFEDGVTATATLGFCLPDGHPGSIVRTTVVGTDGVATLDGGGEVHAWDGEGGRTPDTHLWPTIDGVPDGALARENRAFVDAVKEGTEPPVPYEAGRDAVAVAAAVERAIATDDAVPVP